MKIKWLFIALVLVLPMFNVFGESLLNFKNLKSIQANFTQKVQNGDGALEYRGFLAARADSMAYWRYEMPLKKEIFIKKNRVMIYEPEFEQMILSENSSIDFMAILGGIERVNGEFISTVGEQKFYITLDSATPREIRYIDELDNTVIITLSNVILNAPIDFKSYELKVPEGTEIIYN